MTLKTTLAALILVLSPALAIAQCQGGHGEQTAMSCAEGMVMDQETGVCIPLSTS